MRSDEQVAESYLDTGNFKEAAQHFEKVIAQLSPPESQAVRKKEFWLYYQLGYALMNAGQHKKALNAFSEAGRVAQKELALVHYHQGSVKMDQQQYEAALAEFDKAIEYNQDYYDAYQNKAVTYRLMGRFKDSVEACKRTVTLFPDFAKAYCSMGWAYEKLNQYEDAIQAHMKAISLSPQWQFPKRRIRYCFSQMKGARAFELLAELEESDPALAQEIRNTID